LTRANLVTMTVRRFVQTSKYNPEFQVTVQKIFFASQNLEKQSPDLRKSILSFRHNVKSSAKNLEKPLHCHLT